VPARIGPDGREGRRAGPERRIGRAGFEEAAHPALRRGDLAGVLADRMRADRRGGGLAQQAAAHAVRDVADPRAVEPDIEGDAVAAQRIVAGQAGVGRIQPAGARRRLGQGDDRILVKIGHERARRWIARSSPWSSASTSSSPLYSARLARAVPARPRRSISGCAQW
jgi:hypothetical protein